jgi:transcriptional regulator of acetoin/glycerol metabolism
LTLILPRLRERSDFQVLTQRLLADLNPGRSVGLAPELLQRLSQHAWPGHMSQSAKRPGISRQTRYRKLGD